MRISGYLKLSDRPFKEYASINKVNKAWEKKYFYFVLKKAKLIVRSYDPLMMKTRYNISSIFFIFYEYYLRN